MLALIVDEAVVQDGYMNALTDGYGSGMSDDDASSLLSVLLAVVVVLAVLAVALILVRRGLDGDLRRASPRSAGALEGVESEHLRPLEPRGQGDQRASSTSSSARCRGSARKAAIVAERRPR